MLPLECDLFIPMAASIADLHEVIALAEAGELRVEVELFAFEDAPARVRPLPQRRPQEPRRRHAQRLARTVDISLVRSPPVARLDDLQRVEKAIVRIARIGAGRDAARNRAERSGVHLCRPAINLISALHASGPVRLSRLSDLTDLEAPLVSREIARLCDGGYVKRRPTPPTVAPRSSPSPPRADRAYLAYRQATDDIVVEAFAGWKAAELRTLADYLERVVHDVSRRPDSV